MTLLLVALGVGVLAALAGAALARRWRVAVASTLGALGCVLAVFAAVTTLRGGATTTFHSAQVLPLSGVSLTLDPLAAWFILVSSIVGAAACVYNVGYAHGALASRPAQSTFMLFTFSLIAVPSASNITTFMFGWELMALSSLLLILTEHARHVEARSAALWYGVMTQLGAASILLGLLLVSSHGSAQSFAAISAHAAGLSPATRSLAFLLVLGGFASKAGAVPLHVWLPKAHPAAPSSVSALMSSAMVAMGVYGIIRVGQGLLHGGTVWWWFAVTLLGVVSAMYGALHATTSNDLKRLLAYSTIDIIGLVLTGVGAAGALKDSGQPMVAHLALGAALLLVLAHAAFKGALFLAAGAIDRSAGTRDLDLLGGLIHVMPVTATVIVFGAGAIMAVPTLSGFSSEWLLLQSFLHGFTALSTPVVIVMLLGTVALALTGGLTAVAFVKVIGIGFLGRARSEGAANAHEASRSMLVAMGALTIPSVFLGVAPGLVGAWWERAVSLALGRSSDPYTPSTGVVLARLGGAIAPAAVLVALIGVMSLVWLLSQNRTARHARRVDAWGCGRDGQTSRMQYTATSFAEPLQRVFADVLRPQSDVEVTHVVESRYYEQSLSYESRIVDVFEARGYRPIIGWVLRAGGAARRLQNGSLDRYLAFGFGALIAILVVG